MNFEVAVSLLKNQTLVYLKQSHKVMTRQRSFMVCIWQFPLQFFFIKLNFIVFLKQAFTVKFFVV